MIKKNFPIQLKPYSVARVFEVLRSMPNPQIKTKEMNFPIKQIVISFCNKGGVVLYTYGCHETAYFYEIRKQLKEEFGYVQEEI